MVKGPSLESREHKSAFMSSHDRALHTMTPHQLPSRTVKAIKRAPLGLDHSVTPIRLRSLT